jgi:predicted glycosyltransferase
MRTVLEACRRLMDRPLHLEAFCGPFMSAEEFNELHALRAAGRSVRRFTPRLIDYLTVADLSISLAGYNTCMNLLATGVPALVLPYARQREQPLRIEKLKPYLPLTVIGEDDLDPDRLARIIETGLKLRPRSAPAALNIDGAVAATRFLESWVAPGRPSLDTSSFDG